MIKVENIEVWGFEHAIRGMRNPLNSWDRSDSYPAVDCGKCGRIEREGICHPKEHDCTPYYCYEIGENDLTLMRKLFAAGHPHRKYLRQIFVAMDITAPLYWWKEFDTYKVGTTANSCSTMHKIAVKEFELSDFSTVTLSVSSYNSVKNDVFRYNLFLDNLLQEAMLSEDHQSLVFDSKKIEEAVKFCYFERYKKKKLATLRTQATKYGDKK